MRRGIKLALAMVIASFLLDGCAAAPIVAYGLTAAYTGYSFYQISKDATAEFDIKESKPSTTNSQKIKNLKSLAIYPLGSDGQAVDAASSVLDMQLVSPSKTVRWMAKTQDLPLNSLPQSEKIQSLGKMARAVGGDAALYIKLGDAEADIGVSTYIGLMDVSANVPTQYYLVDKHGNLLWSEEATLKVTGTGVGEEQLVAVLIDAVSNRIMDIRLDREIKQKKSKNWTAIFECGGKLNFTCKDKPSTENQADSPTQTEPTEKLIITKDLVKRTQVKLNQLGFSAGSADGLMGSKTKQALREFQSLNSLSVTGNINRETVDALSVHTE